MKNKLLFDFIVNKENNTILIKREFNAPLKTVWKAWSEPALLNKWWGPKPWYVETKSMDFKTGGHWLYVMIGPAGEQFWSKVHYREIKTEQSITARDGFCDENGEMNSNFPQNDWVNLFKHENGITTIDLVLTFDNLEDLEQTVAMGFKEGFTIGLNQLEELLPALI
ncbi:SRPBCC family protein [Pedobacter flavus]|uniref:SRPBCC domain-containing protein n=1 Tax=Pedobacter flavus TaxID=3113906 RepID=A0ABU7H191_9SPHI|nr:SRPBCC domain-containing protein [Pedobacter sp. VNH31]MEE1885006.1 SRPBCC domain-containing protein [Pedobacter sp. VNH31]